MRSKDAVVAEIREILARYPKSNRARVLGATNGLLEDALSVLEETRGPEASR